MVSPQKCPNSRKLNQQVLLGQFGLSLQPRMGSGIEDERLCMVGVTAPAKVLSCNFFAISLIKVAST